MPLTMVQLFLATASSWPAALINPCSSERLQCQRGTRAGDAANQRTS
jgi:hypothetical protein